MSKAAVAAVIVAAGNSTRMGTPKQFLPLGDRPVIAHTLAAFEQSPCITEIVLVAREEDIPALRDIADTYAIRKLHTIVVGGADRQQSVTNGVHACSDAVAIFAIHDGARPLVRPTDIEAVVTAAVRDGAAALAVRVKDTIKVADADGFIADTPDRATLWSVQTPQVFERTAYLNALDTAKQRGVSYTDDCQLLEAVGKAVRLVEGSYTNLKITTPEDITVAEGLL